MFKYPVSQPFIGEAEIQAVTDTLRMNRITQGQGVIEFERRLANFINVPHVIVCSSGTAALHLALAALELKPGDEVLVPDLTYVASVNAIKYVGATPVLVDIDHVTWNIDLQAAEKKITEKTKAILVVHLYGNPCNMDQVMTFSKKFGIEIIEDAAEALGGTWRNKPLGTFGKFGTFSFYANKIITTGEGGAVVTSNKLLAEKLRLLRGQGQTLGRRFYHEVLGFNYRMTDIQAVIGVSQMTQIGKFISARQNVIINYRSELFARFEFPIIGGAAPWLFTVVTKTPYPAVREYMEKAGIETRPIFVPMHQLPMYEQNDAEFPVSTRLATYGISLPTYPGLTKRDILFISTTLCEAAK